jgi:hypothetical protein
MKIRRLCVVLIAGVWLSSATATAAELVIVENGRAKAVDEVGQRWSPKDGYLECFGPHSFLVAKRTLGAGDFRIRARLSLEKIENTAASLVINGNHFGFDGRQGDKWKYHVEGPEFGRLNFLDSSLAPGRPFEFEVIRVGSLLTFRIDGQEVCRVPYSQNEVVQFGLLRRADRCRQT